MPREYAERSALENAAEAAEKTKNAARSLSTFDKTALSTASKEAVLLFRYHKLVTPHFSISKAGEILSFFELTSKIALVIESAQTGDLIN